MVKHIWRQHDIEYDEKVKEARDTEENTEFRDFLPIQYPGINAIYDAVLLPMQYLVINVIYHAIYDAWLTYICYIHVIDADSDYEDSEFEDYMYIIKDDEDSDEDSDSDENSEYGDSVHYNVDDTEVDSDEDSEYGDSGYYIQFDTEDEDSNEGSDSDKDSEYER